MVQFMPQKGMGSSVCPVTLPKGLLAREYLKKLTHGWICGAIPHTEITAMRFLFWVLRSSMANMEVY